MLATCALGLASCSLPQGYVAATLAHGPVLEDYSVGFEAGPVWAQSDPPLLLAVGGAGGIEENDEQGTGSGDEVRELYFGAGVGAPHSIGEQLYLMAALGFAEIDALQPGGGSRTEYELTYALHVRWLPGGYLIGLGWHNERGLILALGTATGEVLD